MVNILDLSSFPAQKLGGSERKQEFPQVLPTFPPS